MFGQNTEYTNTVMPVLNKLTRFFGRTSLKYEISHKTRMDSKYNKRVPKWNDRNKIEN